jgi:UDP-N-acetylmuramate: L-alanyl-gamma-D-glutamyl-meso-diaminopimelate ligase
VFQDDFARAFGAADEVILAPVFRSTLPEAERLDTGKLVDQLRARGQRARVGDNDDIIRAIVDEHHSGDVVVLMSNGGFGGIHRKLLQALGA